MGESMRESSLRLGYFKSNPRLFNASMKASHIPFSMSKAIYEFPELDLKGRKDKLGNVQWRRHKGIIPRSR